LRRKQKKKKKKKKNKKKKRQGGELREAEPITMASSVQGLVAIPRWPRQKSLNV
jgi:hypothetical protein